MPDPDDDAGPAVGSAGSSVWTRLFGTPAFARLWAAQVVSATGDWIGLIAIIALAERVGGNAGGAAVSLVMAARVVPGFFLGPVAGVLVDRWNRKRVMVACDIGRAAVLASLPFVDTVFALVVASLVLEVLTLLWSPAKEATVPNIVPADHLTTANSLSLVAAYGTFPIGTAVFALLAGIADQIHDHGWVQTLRLNQEGLPLQADALTFLASAAIIWSIALPARTPSERRAAAGGRSLELGSAFRDLREGWRFIFINPIVRSVNLGLATGLIGGGMLIPLGSAFAKEVLGAGDAGYGAFVTFLGLGVAVSVIALSALHRHLPKPQVFALAVVMAGVTLLVAASSATLVVAGPLVFVIGACAGTVYVLGFTLLHENVDDHLRGRIFSALYTLVRLCVLIALLVGPLLKEGLDRVSSGLWDETIDVLGVEVFVPGVRLTLWLAGLIIVGAGLLTAVSLRAGGHRVRAALIPRRNDR